MAMEEDVGTTQRREQAFDEENQILIQPSSTPRSIRSAVCANQWPTIDGSLGLSVEDSVICARKFFLWGFCLMPLFWAINCFYFWPVLRFCTRSSSSAHPFAPVRKYVLRSAIGVALATTILFTWSLTFMVGGVGLFGPSWNDLVMYNVAEKYGLIDWT